MARVALVLRVACLAGCGTEDPAEVREAAVPAELPTLRAETELNRRRAGPAATLLKRVPLPLAGYVDRMATRAIPIRTSSVRDAVHDVAACFSEHSLLTYASAIAYRALIALVPLTLLGLALLGVFGLEDVWTDTIAPVLKDHLTQPVYSGIDFTVQQIFKTDSTPLIALSTALVIWDMTWAVNAVTQALNRIHDVEDHRSKLRRIAVAVGLGIAVVACLIAATLVQSIAPALTGGALDTVLSIVRWPISILFLWAAVTLLFRYAPAEKPEMRWASIGSILVIATWLVASALFRGWVTEVANFKSATGSLTVFLLLTAYILVTSTIFLIGAELDERMRKEKPPS